MNYSWLFFFFLALNTLTLSAQHVGKTGRNKLITQFEIAAGVSRSMNKGYYDMLPKYGYSLGIGATHAFSPSFALGVRALWESKGSKVERRNQGHSESGPIDETMYIDTDFEYLTFSILPTFKPGNKKRLFFGIGGYYSLLRGGSISVSMEDHITNSTITHRHVDIRNFVVKYDAGATAFAGYPFLFTRKGYASLQLSYSKGLVDVNDVWNHYQRNNTLLLIVAFNFGS